MNDYLYKSTISGSRENLYDEHKVNYIKKQPPKINEDDLRSIEKFYEQINRDYYKNPIPSCCKTYMDACFNSEDKGWYCKKCFKWLKDDDRQMYGL